MSAYKKLNRQDVFVSDYIARKQWEASGSVVSDYNIQTLRGLATGSNFGYEYPNDYFLGSSQKLIHRSLHHLYYADSLFTGIYSGSRDLALQSTLTVSGSRHLRQQVGVLSIPNEVYGTHVQPNTFILKPYLVGTGSNYFVDRYCTDYNTGDDLFTENIEYLYGSNPIDTQDYIISESTYVTESVLGTSPGQYIDIDKNQQRNEIVDDGEGALIFSGSEFSFTKERRVVGDIIYNQGQVVLTDEVLASYYTTYLNPILRWKSNQPIYTYNVHCKVKDSEMNFTYNPSAVTGSYGQLRNNTTGSYFTPYVTTIGLYNDANELIAVAKTGKPIPKSRNSDMTFVIKLDL